MNPRSPTAVDVYVAKRIREARKHAGMSQGEFGEDIGVTFQQLQKYEKATNRVSAGKLAAIADRCGRDIRFFFPPRQTRGYTKAVSA